MKRSLLRRSLKTIIVFSVLVVLLFLGANHEALRSEYRAITHTELPAISTSPTGTLADTIRIPTLGVEAPINWDIADQNTTSYLDKGVAQLAGSAYPGQTGNLFITGHSSDYFYKHNPYASVFATLPRLHKGDEIIVTKNNTSFTYTVTDTFIVHPTQVEVANPTSNATLTLLTCYPVGTTRDRYIVKAELKSDSAATQKLASN